MLKGGKVRTVVNLMQALLPPCALQAMSDAGLKPTVVYHNLAPAELYEKVPTWHPRMRLHHMRLHGRLPPPRSCASASGVSCRKCTPWMGSHHPYPVTNLPCLVPWLPVPQALQYEPSSHIVAGGALAAISGAKTGRSPQDKRIVREPSSEQEVWWGEGSPNFEMDER
jgi:hypothetical protein